MTKLLLLDKDGTLVSPASGSTFPQNPKDQQLLPGVAEMLSRYVADGWLPVIVSNQGGCAWQTTDAGNIAPGMLVKIQGQEKRVRAVNSDPDDENQIWLECDRPASFGLWADDPVQFRFKSEDEAIEEMRYCQELTGIDLALFCPDDGSTCYRVRKGHDRPWNRVPFSRKNEEFGSFRKPGPGMLNFAVSYYLRPDVIRNDWAKIKQQSLMIGDRPEDQQAAHAAGVPFTWAGEWRAGL